MRKALLFSLSALLLGGMGFAEPRLPENTGAKWVRRQLTPEIELIAMRTGWVAVKHQHRELQVAPWLAIPAIFLGGWSDWMPIISYLVRHPEGNILVDTGPDTAINDSDYFSADPNNGFFYRRNLRFHIPPEESLPAYLHQLNLPPTAIDHVLITHFHADHIGYLGLFAPHATVHTGPGNWPGHIGSFTARLPADFKPTISTYQPAPGDIFARSQPLTADGRIHIVPLNGHTPGHSGLWIRTDTGKDWLIAGDATFDIPQTQRTGIAGVSQNMPQARETQRFFARNLDRLTLLPAHDPAVFKRLSGSESPLYSAQKPAPAAGAAPPGRPL